MNGPQSLYIVVPARLPCCCGFCIAFLYNAMLYRKVNAIKRQGDLVMYFLSGEFVRM